MIANKKVIGSFAAAVSFVIYTVITILYMRTSGKVSFKYGLVLDAGSSKTTMTMFRWPAEQLENTGVVEQVGKECKTKGGIDDLGNDVNTTISNLTPCLHTVTDLIEKDETGRTPNYLAATAGLRIVDLRDPNLARFILDSVSDFLRNFTTNGNGTIKYDVVMSDVISGVDEGFFSWIAVNYMLKTLKLGQRGPDTAMTLGILDLGGGSRQIAYQDIHQSLPNEQVIDSTLYGINYKIRSTTDLCFGADEVWNRHVYMLVTNKSNSVDDPCMLKGSTIEVMGSELAENPCLKTKYGNGVVKLANNYTLNGSGNFDTCLIHVNEMVNKCDNEFIICLKDEDQPPPSDMRLIATSGYYYITGNLSIKDKTTQNDFFLLIKSFCNQNWTDGKREDMAKMDCLKALFIYESWTKKYKFNTTTFENIDFRNKLLITDKNASISWAMGLMINATNAIPPEAVIEPVISTLPFSFVTAACIAVILIVVIYGTVIHETNDRSAVGLSTNEA